MIRSEDRNNYRYNQDRNNKFMEFISREMHGRTSKNRQSRILSNNQTSKNSNNHNSSDIYSQPQLIKPKRGASIIRTNSKSKYAESMGKFRKDFIKDTAYNFYQAQVSTKVKKQKEKEQTKIHSNTEIVMENDVGVEDMHYKMVMMQQNIKKMHRET